MVSATLTRVAAVIGATMLVVGAVLAWYFTQGTGTAAGSNGNYYLEAYDPLSTAKFRLLALKSGDQFLLNYEVINDTTPGEPWVLWKTANTLNGATALYAISSDDQTTWSCSLLSAGDVAVTPMSGVDTAAGAASFDSDGFSYMTFNTAGYNDSATFMVQLYKDPVSKLVKINNFGGFLRDETRPNAGFTLDGDGQTVDVPSKFPSFKVGLPALQDISTCQVPELLANFNSESLMSSTAPICGSLASLRAYVMQQVYAARAPHAFTQCGVTCGQYSTVASGDTAYICTGHATGAWFVFAGSQNMGDWVSNFQVSSTSAFGMKVHSGFYNKALQWQTKVDTFLVANPGPVVFMGHSLGGAIASVAAVYARKMKARTNVEIVTEGEPAAFKALTADFTAIPHTRYLDGAYYSWSPNQCDPVASSTAVFGYVHSGVQSWNQLKGSSYNQGNPGCTLIIGYVMPSLHTNYPAYMDGARRSSA